MVQATERLAILGFGEASYEIARGLHAAGLPGTHIWKRQPWSATVLSRAREAGATLCADPCETVKGADIVFSLVTPTAAPEVAERAACGLAGKYYLDLNAASLRTKEQAAEIVETAGGLFVDGAIMGPLKRQQHRVSTLVSGPEAAKLAATLRSWEMDVRAIGTRIGLASTVKMIRSVYTKGLEALVLEFMVAANHYGATEEVLDSLEEILRIGPFLLPFRQMVAELILEQAPHGARRVAEMEQVVRTLEEIGIEPLIARATLARLQWGVSEVRLKEHFADGSPESYQQVLDVIEQTALQPAQ